MGGYIAPPVPGSTPVNPNPLRSLNAEYRAGHYTQVETEAAALVAAQQNSPDALLRKQAAQAEMVSAYSAARRKNFVVADGRFLQVRDMAEGLPDHGAIAAPLGQVEPTLEEEAVFQHAVCIGAQGNQQASEESYKDFLHHYPDSILIHAAVKRMAHNHGGDIPKDAEALWTQDMKIQKEHDRLKKREQSLCAPECLAELLRRQGKTVDVHALANEMHTSDQGTSLQDFATIAQKHGWKAQGLQLTPKGLAAQKLPAIALVTPGHFVLVEKVEAQSIILWNPDAQGTGKPALQQVPLAQWQKQWQGITLAQR